MEKIEEQKESSQELMFKASMLERHLQELNQRIDYISQQLVEMEEFEKNLKFLKNSKGKGMFSSVGRGVYTKSDSTSNELFVNVGAGVVVKKTPEETAEIVKTQIKSFYEAKNSLMAQLEAYNGMMRETVSALDKAKKV